VQYLLEQGADVFATLENGRTAEVRSSYDCTPLVLSFSLSLFLGAASQPK
jgi:hypothetical protein